MGFNLAVPTGGDFTPYIKFNAKAGRWYTRFGDSSEESEVKQMIAVIDLEQIKSGWMHFVAGTAPNYVMDGPAGMAPKPSDDHKRGFTVEMFSSKYIGGKREWSSSAASAIAAVLDIKAKYDAEKAANPGKLPLVECVDVLAIASKNGTNYQPVFEIKGWFPRPAELPLAPSVAPTSQNREATQTARHAPPPSAPAPRAPADAEVQF